MANLKWFVVFVTAAFRIGFTNSLEKNALLLLVEKTESNLINETNKICTYEENQLVCDLSKPGGEKYGSVHVHSGISTNVTIVGATSVDFQEKFCCFKYISFYNSKLISTNRGNNIYKLLLQNSTGTNINDSAIEYLKAENSFINLLDLKSVNEFDVGASYIETFHANSKESLRSTLIGSTVKKLSLTIAEPSWLFINDTTIDIIEKITFKNTQPSHIVNTAIRIIRPNAITIENGSTVSMDSVVFKYLAPESIVVHGTLILVNVIYLKAYPLDWVVLMPGGSLTLSKHSTGNNSLLQNYSVTNINFEFRPFEVIEVPKEVWLPITLGAILLISLLCIGLLLLWIFMFTGKKLPPLMKINVQKKIDEQEFFKLEKDRPVGSVRNVTRNVYVPDNQECPTPPNDHSDPESQQDYVDIDPNDQVNYSELDEKIPNNVNTSSVIKINMDEKAPNNEKTDMKIIPPKVPASLPPQKFTKPKPAVPKREWPPPDTGVKQPNKSFLQNINPKFLNAPPPPSKTVLASAIGNFQQTQNKMPTLPPIITKQSHDSDELCDSQEEYDVCEESDD